jgi:hypothetical protein
MCTHRHCLLARGHGYEAAAFAQEGAPLPEQVDLLNLEKQWQQQQQTGFIRIATPAIPASPAA